MKKIEIKIVKFIRETSGGKPVVLGLSGGIDSAVVAALCVKALEKVNALIMPEKGVTKQKDLDDAIKFAKAYKIYFEIHPISHIVESISFRIKDRKVMGNVKARVRMVLLYTYANLKNMLVAGTGNKSEIMTGYFTKYGDGAADFLPIGDLYKTEVIKLARHLGIPETIIKKEPSAGLWHEQTDEKEMGMSYEELDKALQEKKVPAEIKNKVKMLVENSRHKREMPKVCRIT